VVIGQKESKIFIFVPVGGREEVMRVAAIVVVPWPVFQIKIQVFLSLPA